MDRKSVKNVFNNICQEEKSRTENWIKRSDLKTTKVMNDERTPRACIVRRKKKRGKKAMMMMKKKNCVLRYKKFRSQ